MDYDYACGGLIDRLRYQLHIRYKMLNITIVVYDLLFDKTLLRRRDRNIPTDEYGIFAIFYCFLLEGEVILSFKQQSIG